MLEGYEGLGTDRSATDRSHTIPLRRKSASSSSLQGWQGHVPLGRKNRPVGRESCRTCRGTIGLLSDPIFP